MVIEKDFVASTVAQALFEEPAKPTCCHHWVIETAHGPVSWGVCQICHQGKEFMNSIGEIERES